MLAVWWGDLSSLAGLVVGLPGFIITIILLLKSKNAAEAAEAAADETKRGFERVLTLTDLTTAVATGEEIARLQRKEAWSTVVDRYTHLRRLLIGIREENPNIAPEHKKAIQGTITQVILLQEKVEKVSMQAEKPDIPRLNSILSNQMDVLEALAASVKFKGARI
jgi:hypothetical protein